MKITVTSTDIEQGRPCDPNRCALALAVKRAFSDDTAWVGYSIAYAGESNYELPVAAVAFHRKFDMSKKNVEPFEFDLV